MKLSEISDLVKENGGTVILVLFTMVASAVNYGASQATAAATIANHENRLAKVEQHDEEYGKTLARVDQRLSDIWRDLGHKE